MGLARRIRHIPDGRVEVEDPRHARCTIRDVKAQVFRQLGTPVQFQGVDKEAHSFVIEMA
jgi:hypothetical protein